MARLLRAVVCLLMARLLRTEVYNPCSTRAPERLHDISTQLCNADIVGLVGTKERQGLHGGVTILKLEHHWPLKWGYKTSFLQKLNRFMLKPRPREFSSLPACLWGGLVPFGYVARQTSHVVSLTGLREPTRRRMNLSMIRHASSFTNGCLDCRTPSLLALLCSSSWMSTINSRLLEKMTQ